MDGYPIVCNRLSSQCSGSWIRTSASLPELGRANEMILMHEHSQDKRTKLDEQQCGLNVWIIAAHSEDIEIWSYIKGSMGLITPQIP